ncbi:MAG: VWA domain-containing protein [Deltaproteobacteria bacterium]|nr:VWA domain-containing protein [Deltaproteobacteria bacterium]
MRTRNLGIVGLLAFMVGCGASAKAPAASYGGAGRGEAVYASAPAEPAGYPAPPAAEPAGAPSMPGGAAMPATASAPPSPAKPSAPPAPAAAKAAEAPIAVAPTPPPPPRDTRPLPRAGQLTAGVWDDNRNFDFWRPYAIRFTDQHGSDFAMFTAQELEAARAESVKPHDPRNELDVQLVLDTTGSMGDELSYLQSEFESIAAQVRAKFPQVTPRWSLVLYKDRGDEYVTRGFDFTSDTARFRQQLRAQSAGGGGDIPEAVVEGLGKGLEQSWRAQSPNVAKIIFWVADAPAHPGEGQKLAHVIRTAKKKGVHIYPVASSDTDDAAEYQMRAAAQMTSGRYVFLTNDSGIGNSHAEPHIPCYNVSRLDHAIVRMIQVELSGRFDPVESQQVLRSVGQPDKEGKCKLASGALVASF